MGVFLFPLQAQWSSASLTGGGTHTTLLQTKLSWSEPLAVSLLYTTEKSSGKPLSVVTVAEIFLESLLFDPRSTNASRDDKSTLLVRMEVLVAANAYEKGSFVLSSSKNRKL